MNAAEKKMRLGLYAKIAIARKQLPDMDEEAYRARLRTEFGKESAADLSVVQLSRLVHDFAVHDGVAGIRRSSRSRARTGLKLRTACPLRGKNGKFSLSGGSSATA